MSSSLRRLPFIVFCVLLQVIPSHGLSASKGKAAEEGGALLFRDKGCAYCHGVGAVGTRKAPALTDLRKDKAWPPAKITNQILDGGQKMPPFRESLTDDEVTQLVAYIRAKHKPPPPPAAPPPSS